MNNKSEKILEGKFFDTLKNEIKDLQIDNSLKENLYSKLINDYKEQKILLNKSFDVFEKKKYTDPILRGISMLPKSEMAKLAEAMIKITSLNNGQVPQRKFYVLSCMIGKYYRRLPLRTLDKLYRTVENYAVSSKTGISVKWVSLWINVIETLFA